MLIVVNYHIIKYINKPRAEGSEGLQPLGKGFQSQDPMINIPPRVSPSTALMRLKHYAQ